MTIKKETKPRVKRNTSRVGSGTKEQKIEDVVDVYLTHEEMSKMDEFSYKQQIHLLNHDKSKLEEEKLSLKVEKLLVDLEIQKVKSASLIRDLKEEGQRTKAFVKSLKDKYQVKAEEFSYIPITGKLILEDIQ